MQNSIIAFYQKAKQEGEYFTFQSVTRQYQKIGERAFRGMHYLYCHYSVLISSFNSY